VLGAARALASSHLAFTWVIGSVIEAEVGGAILGSIIREEKAG
jgi:hypothetical protein